MCNALSPKLASNFDVGYQLKQVDATFERSFGEH